MSELVRNLETVDIALGELTKTEKRIKSEVFLEELMAFEKALFTEGFYQIGPIIIEVKPSQFDETEQDYMFYAQTNQVGQKSSIRIRQGLRLRVPFDEHLEDALDTMKQYLINENYVWKDKLYLFMQRVYGEYWVDLVIPCKRR